MKVRLAPVISFDGERTIRAPEVELEPALLSSFSSLKRSLSVYSSGTSYIATTGGFTLKFATHLPNMDVRSLFDNGAKCALRILDDTNDLLWSGVGVDTTYYPFERTISVKFRQAHDSLRQGRVFGLAEGATRTLIDWRDLLRPVAQSILGYDMARDLGDDSAVNIYRPDQTTDALSLMESVLPWMHPTRRFFVYGTADALEFRPLRPRATSVVITEALGSLSIEDGRKQAWNVIRFRYWDPAADEGNGDEADGVFEGDLRDARGAPYSRQIYGRRELNLNLAHLGKAEAEAVARGALYRLFAKRRRAKIRTPAVVALALMDVVELDIRMHNTPLAEPITGRWLIQEMGFDPVSEHYDLTLVELFLGDDEG